MVLNLFKRTSLCNLHIKDANLESFDIAPALIQSKSFSDTFIECKI